MLETLLRPEVLLSNVIVCLVTFLITRWMFKPKSKSIQPVEIARIPKQTMDGTVILELSLSTLQSYKNNLNKYGYVYFRETTPIVIQQLTAEANGLIPSKENQLIREQLQHNYEQLTVFQQQEATDTKKLELEVLNHVNKTIITWRNLLKSR
ncbi:hypothetical protein [Enterococcus xiangfangensis]|uniref:Uncharacterized protein n=1 Tax=Enterococcus xiangfangensis TaxID=1296537 RepID=A0ABU3F8W4_9ENTE|nr:hypothetical protein [Enterococcus xiangfangensis]MBM7711202.1 hypothetical protein [Enterococcus xiangfangensis]MDT2759101.1 hypothetical protein [Enterococcus xiangfangensis]NBK09264.1 hypothetical protein [Enterococcus asini]